RVTHFENMMKNLTKDGFRARCAQRSFSGQGLRRRWIDPGRQAAAVNLRRWDDLDDVHQIDRRRNDRRRNGYGEAAMAMMVCQITLFGMTGALVDERDSGFARSIGDIEVTETVEHAADEVHPQHKDNQRAA